MTLNCIWGWGTSSGNLGSLEYPFIAISLGHLSVVVAVWFLSIGQIDLFKNRSYSKKIPDATKLYIICIKNSYLLLYCYVMYSYGPPHMTEQKQGDQLKPTYSRSVRILGVALRTSRKQWTIGRGSERGPGISVLMTQQDDDDDDYI